MPRKFLHRDNKRRAALQMAWLMWKNRKIWRGAERPKITQAPGMSELMRPQIEGILALQFSNRIWSIEGCQEAEFLTEYLVEYGDKVKQASRDIKVQCGVGQNKRDILIHRHDLSLFRPAFTHSRLGRILPLLFQVQSLTKKGEFQTFFSRVHGRPKTRRRYQTITNEIFMPEDDPYDCSFPGFIMGTSQDRNGASYVTGFKIPEGLLDAYQSLTGKRFFEFCG